MFDHVRGINCEHWKRHKGQTSQNDTHTVLLMVISQLNHFWWSKILLHIVCKISKYDSYTVNNYYYIWCVALSDLCVSNHGERRTDIGMLGNKCCYWIQKFPGKPDEIKYEHCEQRRFSHFSPLMNNLWFSSWLTHPWKLPPASCLCLIWCQYLSLCLSACARKARHLILDQAWKNAVGWVLNIQSHRLSGNESDGK